ncbi:MAG TPA: AAA family ATPase [Candidatus Coprocola pullicola]|nr:AAA family ATPase [Candidatus Coprocola pullicola]
MRKHFFAFLEEKKYCFDEIAKDISVIQQLKYMEQNYDYHEEGNVYCHTKLVCEYIIENHFFALESKQKNILFTAALFHDVGKQYSTKIENGKIVSPFHGKKGEKLFREFFFKNQQFFIPLKEREQIANLIAFHMLPMNFIEKVEIDYFLIKASWCVDMKLLYLLSLADINGRICKDKKTLLQTTSYFREYANEIECFDTKKSFFNNYTKWKYFQNHSVGYHCKIFDATLFDVMVLCGLPLSGKDTYISMYLNDMCCISLDDIRQKYKISPTENAGKVVQTAIIEAKQYLRKKQPFVWNATNIIFDTRQKLCNLFSNYGARVTFIYIEGQYHTLLQRNQVRQRTIPENVLNKMIQKMDFLQNYEGYQTKYFISEQNHFSAVCF